MKVFITIDSFKGSLSSMEAGLAVKDGVLRAKPLADVTVLPLADGGEGTANALIEGFGGERVEVTVTGPLGEPVKCYYGILDTVTGEGSSSQHTRTAVMEMASAAGITLIPEDKKNPLAATTFGVGEMILHALENGCRNFIIGIGGSATNDGGIGMLKALGFEFLDKNGLDVGEGGQALERIAYIDCAKVNSNISLCNFKVACDVTNPLCGENGATFIYGPQKGVTDNMKAVLDAGMANYAQVAAALGSGTDYSAYPGAGAAGGLGFAFLTFFILVHHKTQFRT